jgi:hypothetical protein
MVLKKISLTEIVIFILLIIILLQRCGGGKQVAVTDGIKIVKDTVWIHTDSTINSKPQIIKTEPYAVPVDRWNTEYLPDSNYSRLLNQYKLLVRELLAKNIQSDSIKIDSIGHVYITDTVSKNTIIGRSTHYSLKYPVITTTITIPEKKKTQWYIGGSVQGQQGQIINQLSTGILIKNKKDQIYGGYVGMDASGGLQIGIQSYWKIKLHK